MRSLASFILVACLIACHSKEKAYQKYLNKDVLPTQVFTVNTAKDTVLETANGAIIKIAKGSFSADKINLEVKEAITIEQIIAAGLLTRSNGKTLSSGGMIYINAKENVPINKPINVSLPATFIDEDMKVFKGNKEVGNINWTDPQPLLDQESAKSLKIGKQLFQQNCQSCHAINKKMTGPALAGVTERGPWEERENLYKWVRYPAAFIPTARYTQCLQKEYGSIMPGFPELNNKDIANILNYVESEAARNGWTTGDRTLCADSCRLYDSLYNHSVQSLNNKQNALIEDNGPRIKYERLTDSSVSQPMQSRDGTGQIPKVKPENYNAIYYQFDIKSFGWYNIDALLEEKFGNIELKVAIDERYTNEYDVFIAVPAYKVFDRGGKLENENKFGFLYLDGKMPLPVGAEVMVFTIGEAQGKIAFTSKKFTAIKRQTIELQPELISPEEFKKAISQLLPQKISIDVVDSKNAAEIRSIDKKIEFQEGLIEKYRPKNCNCGCEINEL
jgi:mono/diheme cytochrome c family protein